MNKFIKVGDVLVNVDNITVIVDEGEKRMIYMVGDDECLAIDASQTLEELLNIISGN